MDEIEIGGTRYISSKRASEITGYAKDYIGQLARGGKIAATRVGRAWYVDEQAIKKHAGISSDAGETIKGEEGAENTPLPAGTTFSIQRQDEKRITLNTLRDSIVREASLKTWGDIRYFPDDSSLFPATTAISREASVHFERSTDTEKIHHKVAVAIPHRQMNISVDGVVMKALPKEEAVQNPVVHGKDDSKKPSEIKSFRTSRLSEKKYVPLNPKLILYSIILGNLLLIFGLMGGTYFPSEWDFHTTSLIANTSAFESALDPISAYFDAIFQGGLALIVGFFTALFGSLEDFFDIGLDFIFNLFNLG